MLNDSSLAFKKWKELRARHVEELSLMESYRYVKREGASWGQDRVTDSLMSLHRNYASHVPSLVITCVNYPAPACRTQGKGGENEVIKDDHCLGQVARSFH